MSEFKLHIKGLVQGVGFRPFIYRIASQLNIPGEVRNDNEGVYVCFNASESQKERFIRRIMAEKPAASDIHEIDVTEVDTFTNYDGFRIIESQTVSDRITDISPDISTCDECLEEIKLNPLRLNYPFTNCTNCGPRFSIIKSLPYDRSSTTMKDFVMCPQCTSQYINVRDRRFHAQPIACLECGPHYTIYCSGENHTGFINLRDDKQIGLIADNIALGRLVALKGIGGYNLLCDAFNPASVTKLRELKLREHKPLAVMFRDVETAKKYVRITQKEEAELKSWRKPILLLKQIKTFNQNINDSLSELGIILPYAPVHTILFSYLKTDAVVFTSANISNQPIISDDQDIMTVFQGKTEIIARHNRPVSNPLDDSVIKFINDRKIMIRRSRGFVPEPFYGDFNAEGILSLGAENNSYFAIGRENKIILSQYHGNTAHEENLDFLKSNIERFSELYNFKPSMICCDLHPGYNTTRLGRQLSFIYDIPLIQVQHHYAHALAALGEHNIKDNTLCVVFDGAGYGMDNNIWGSEFMICDTNQFIRLNHFDYVSLPGGDMAPRQSWRSAIAFTEHYGLTLPDSFLERIDNDNINAIKGIIDLKLNSPLGCGAGRIFDAAASLTGISDFNHYQGQSAMKFESAASSDRDSQYDFDHNDPLNNKSLFESVINDINNGKEISEISSKFHNTLVRKITFRIIEIIISYGLPRRVILSGGCFQNAILLHEITKTLERCNIHCIIADKYPLNDGGIAFGQIFYGSQNR